MAYYYWSGAQSSDVNNRYNYTFWNPYQVAGSSVSPPPETYQTPGNGDVVVFTQLRVTGGTPYPIYGPSGTFMNGLTGASAAPTALAAVMIEATYPKGIGTSLSTPLNVYANLISVLKGPTANVSLGRYFNFLTHPSGSGQVPLVTYSGNNAPYPLELYFTGNANVQSTPFAGSRTYSNATFRNFTGKIGPFNNVEGQDNIYLDSTVSPDPYQKIYIGGKYSTVYINKGFATAEEGPIRFLSVWSGTQKPTQRLVFNYDTYQGSSGPDAFARSTVEIETDYSGTPFSNPGYTACYAGATMSPTIDIYHGVELTKLNMYAGNINFYNEVNQTARIFNGSMVAQTCTMNIPNPNSVAFVSGQTGFYVITYPAGPGCPPQSGMPLNIGVGGDTQGTTYPPANPWYTKVSLAADDNWPSVIVN